MLNQILEAHDLTGLHTVASLIGVFAAVHLMQLSWHNPEDFQDGIAIRWMHRTSLAAIALALLWSVNYAEIKHWQPWPADVFVIIALDFRLILRAISLHLRGVEQQSGRLVRHR